MSLSAKEGRYEVYGVKNNFSFVQKLMLFTGNTNLKIAAHAWQTQEKRPKVQRTETSMWLVGVPLEGANRGM